MMALNNVFIVLFAILITASQVFKVDENNDFENVSFERYNKASGDLLGIYQIKIPTSCEFAYYIAGGSDVLCKVYKCCDSSYIYIGSEPIFDFFGSNDERIIVHDSIINKMNPAKDLSVALSIENPEFFPMQKMDSIIISGDINEKHWKTISTDYIIIGYFNVPTKRIDIFEKSLLSLTKI